MAIMVFNSAKQHNVVKAIDLKVYTPFTAKYNGSDILGFASYDYMNLIFTATGSCSSVDRYDDDGLITDVVYLKSLNSLDAELA